MTGEEVMRIPGVVDVQAVNFSPDGTMLATADEDAIARIWEIPSGKALVTLYGDTNWMTDIAFSPDGTRIATASWDRTARVWDLLTGRTLFTLSGHEDFVSSIAFSPDGRRLVTGGRDMTVKVWDAAPSSEVVSVDTGTPLARAAMNDDASRLITIGRRALLWNFSHGFDLVSPGAHLLATLRLEPPQRDATFSPDDRLIMTSGSPGVGVLWDADTGVQVATLTGGSFSQTVAFSPDGMRVAMTTEDVDNLHVWETDTGKKLLQVSEARGAVGLIFSPDGKHILTGNVDGSISIRNVATGDLVLNFPAHSNLVWGVSFSPDGSRLVTSSRDATAKVWDTATWKEILTLRGHTSTVERSVFSADGTQILTASSDGTAKLWDAASGEELLTFYGSTASVSSALFSPDSTRVLTSSYDGAVRVYLVRLDDLIALAKTRVTRSLTSAECLKFLRVEQCPNTP
jgi:WD40 repeat protein